ncbi:hypothetical protein K4Q22_00905 [Staphylococcus epidermidis]|uniref:hypothetical protein n=1 Tax=Staphylococcus epidermidis TaxID=1282 RepID=UPI00288382E7|nr:hypothetical protein [Staphylococcus epidermidis]MCG2360584.1 hypothetical protein [Staphylococcus epidermidis]MDT0741422.1 hypothetical protein [Staphylococcus epidermidis]
MTLVAFLFTFWNINRTNKPQELEEQKKNEKTLKMIDLVTQTERAEISKFIHNVDISLQTQPDKNKLYFIEFPEINYETTSKTAVIVNNSARYLEKNSIYMKLEYYKFNIKELLLKQHTNLNLNTLEKSN